MAKDDEGEKKAEEAGGGGKKKLLLIVAPVVLVVVLAAAYFLFLKPSAEDPNAVAEPVATKAAKPSPTSTYLPGAIVKTDSISIGLEGKHYLKLSMALQATADAGEEVSPVKALDAAITLFSGRKMEDLSSREVREKAKEKLVERCKELYEDKVYEIYFTEFVMA